MSIIGQSSYVITIVIRILVDLLYPGIYKHLLSDKKFGLTHNLLACKVMPTLIPLTVAPGLNIEQVRSTF